MESFNLLLINGPNLNLLGTREPDLYGRASLKDIEIQLKQRAHTTGHQINFFQSNAEHLLIERIHQTTNEQIDFILINPAAFTHTSVALRDALSAVNIPFIEIHMSNVYKREPFRKHSYFADLASGIIVGFGSLSYLLAFDAAINYLNLKKPTKS